MSLHEQSELTRAQKAEQQHAARMLGKRLQARKAPPVKAADVSLGGEVENDLGEFASRRGFADLRKNRELSEIVEYKRTLLGGESYVAESFLREAEDRIGAGFNHVLAKAQVHDFRIGKERRKIDDVIIKRNAKGRQTPYVQSGVYGKGSPFGASASPDQFTVTDSSVSVSAEDDSYSRDETQSVTSADSRDVDDDILLDDLDTVLPKYQLPKQPWVLDAGVVAQPKGYGFSRATAKKQEVEYGNSIRKYRAATRDGELTRRNQETVRSVFKQWYDSCDRAAGQDNVGKVNIMELPDGNSVEFGFEGVGEDKHLFARCVDWRGNSMFLEINKSGVLCDAASFALGRMVLPSAVDFESLREMVPLIIETANYAAAQSPHLVEDGQRLPNLDGDALVLVGPTPVLALEDIDDLSIEVWQDHFVMAQEDDLEDVLEDDDIGLELSEYRERYSHSVSASHFENFFNNIGSILKSLFDHARGFVQGFMRSWFGAPQTDEVVMLDEEKRAALDQTRQMFRDLFSEVKEAALSEVETARGVRSLELTECVDCDLYRTSKGEERLVLRIADEENKDHIFIEFDETGAALQHYVLQPPLPNRDLGRKEFSLLAEVVPQVFASCTAKIQAREMVHSSSVETATAARPSVVMAPSAAKTLMDHENKR